MPRRSKKNPGTNHLETGLHSQTIYQLAVYSIETFFDGKEHFSGGKIPQSSLTTDRNVLMVLRLRSTDKLFKFIHEQCLSRIPQPKDYKTNLSWTVHCLLELLRDMKGKWLPQDFQPGLLLMYFELCMNIEIPDYRIFIQ